MKKTVLFLLIPLFILTGCTIEDRRNDTENAFIVKDVEGGVCISRVRGGNEILYIPDKIGGKKVVEIADNVMSDMRRLKKIVVCGDGIRKIGDGAFAGNKDLETVEGLNNLEYIGQYAFAECVSLKEISLNGSFTSIEKGTFTGCVSLEEVILPSGVRTIEDCSFEGCTSLISVTGAENIVSIGEYAFASCGRLSSIDAENAECEYDAFKNSPAGDVFDIPKRPDTIFDGENVLTTVFFDDFDKDDIDLTKWSRCPEWPRQLGVWSDENSFTDKNGNLILLVDEAPNGTLRSGAIRTAGKYSQSGGRFETRCKLGDTPGFWGAFWLMPENGLPDENNGSSADGCEVDIFESPYLSSSSVNYAVHWDGYGENHKSIGMAPSVPYLYYGYHTFTLDWTKTEYIFYIDGIEYWRTSAAGIQEGASYMKLTVEIGTWAGQPVKSEWPTAGLTVDYVKTWQ